MAGYVGAGFVVYQGFCKLCYEVDRRVVEESGKFGFNMVDIASSFLAAKSPKTSINS